jgi:hypothetical protein
MFPFYLSLIHTTQIKPAMVHNEYYNKVKGWIDGYHDAEAVKLLRKFVDNSLESAEVKAQLYKDIDVKIASLKNLPVFIEDKSGKKLLCDASGDVKLFSSKIAVAWKSFELSVKGYDVKIIYGGLHKIELVGIANDNLMMISL